MTTLFLVSFTLTTVASIAGWALVFATLPMLRHAHPGQFAAAGSPGRLTWTLLNVSFLVYLLSAKFRSLNDRRLRAQLCILRAIWLIGLAALATMLATALLHAGA